MLSAELKQARRQTIGASDVGIILGISPWSTTDHDIWLSKKGMDATEETQAMRLGHFLQRGVALEALHQVGGSIIQEEVFAIHPNGWASATPDYTIRQDDANVILEIKTTHERSWDVVPEHYLLQVHWQCWVHGIERAYIAALHGATNVRVYEINVNLYHDWFVDCVARAKQWYDKYMVMGEEPPWGKADDNEHLRTAIRAAAGTSVDLPDDIMAKLRRITQLKKQTGPATKELEQLEKEVKETIGAAEVGLYRGKTVVTYKESVSQSFDTKRFQAEKPDIAKQYTIERVSRRFLPKEDAIFSFSEESQVTC